MGRLTYRVFDGGGGGRQGRQAGKPAQAKREAERRDGRDDEKMGFP